MVHARRPIPRQADVPFHVGIVGEHFAVGIEGEVVRVAEAGRDNFDEAAVGVGAENRAAGRGHAGRVALRIFVARLNQVAFVGRRIGTVGIGLDVAASEIAAEHVDQAVGAKLHAVRSVLADQAAKLDDRLAVVGFAVAVGIGHAIEGAAFGTVARGEHASCRATECLECF